MPGFSVVRTIGYGGAQFYDRRRKISFLTKREAQRAAGRRESGILFERFAKLFFGGRQIVLLFERDPQVISVFRVAGREFNSSLTRSYRLRHFALLRHPLTATEIAPGKSELRPTDALQLVYPSA